MKQLEYRIKERLEDYESSLPEGDLAEFKALLDSGRAASAKRKPLCLAWLAPVAVAAVLALFLVHRNGTKPDMAKIDDGSSLVSDVKEPAVMDTVEESQCMYVWARSLKREEILETRTGIDHYNQDEAETVKMQPEDESMESGLSPFDSLNSFKSMPSGIKVGPAAIGVLGVSGAFAIVSYLPSLFSSDMSSGENPLASPVINREGKYNPSMDLTTEKDVHHMPVQAGISLRIPFNGRWSITSGIEYSWYSSISGNAISKGHHQNVHYLGIPIRVDYTLAGSRWMDVYVGAGVSVDYCIAAYDEGNKIKGDGIGFSLTGTGGIQFNITKNLGLFIEPTLSWNIPLDNRVLETYKTEHPLMLSFPTGIRITLRK